MMERPLATIFVGIHHTHYIITRGDGWFSRCEEAGRQTRHIESGICKLHAPQEPSHFTAPSLLLTPQEQIGLAFLQLELKRLTQEAKFSVDCYRGVLYLRVEGQLTNSGVRQLCNVLEITLQRVIYVTIHNITDEIVTSLQNAAQISEGSARTLLEWLSS